MACLCMTCLCKGTFIGMSLHQLTKGLIEEALSTASQLVNITLPLFLHMGELPDRVCHEEALSTAPVS